MTSLKKIAAALAMLCGAAHAGAAAPRAEVVHWWISGGESAALKVIAARYRAAGGVWIDSAVAGNEQAPIVAVNRILGGNPPAAAQFNLSKQYLDLIEEDLLENVDDVARKGGWDTILPEPIRNNMKVDGHYYAMPVSLHIVNWIWYSKTAFRKAGIRKPPASVPELFAALDKLKAAGLIPLAHGGQPWQENIVFMTLLATVGGKDLYLNVFRDRDQHAIASAGFRQALAAFKRLHAYVDNASAGRTWDASTALLLSGRAGVQIMGDWVKGEIIATGQQPGRDIGCVVAFGARTPLVIQGDAFIFPKNVRADVGRAQKLLADTIVAPEIQVAFSRLKGSIPLVAKGLDPATLDACTHAAMDVMQDRTRHVGADEIYLTAGQNGALTDVLEVFWRTDMTVDEAQRRIGAVLR